MAPGPRTAGRLVRAICRTPVDAKNRSAVKRVRIRLAFAATLLLLVLAGCAGSSLKPDPENDATRRQIVLDALGQVGRPYHYGGTRTAERRVGTECVSTCESRGVPAHAKNKNKT